MIVEYGRWTRIYKPKSALNFCSEVGDYVEAVEALRLRHLIPNKSQCNLVTGIHSKWACSTFLTF